MATAGIFKLLVNDGKADRMILATKLLYQRIQDIMYIRARQGRDDITPTLTDLERTHIIFVNSHFKPFAAIGFEYNKVMGKGEFGTSTQFSIPQFGDFFHDMVARVTIDQAYGNTGFTPLQTLDNTIDQTTVVFPAGVNGNTTTPNYSYNIVDFMGNLLVKGNSAAYNTLITQPPQAQYRNLVRYCEFPANRLFQDVKFDVNGNPLDEYNYCIPMMLEKFTVPTIKRIGYNRLVGQQNPINGYSPPKANVAYDNINSFQNIKSVANTGSSSNQAAGLYQPTNTFSNGHYINKSQQLTKYNTLQSNNTIGIVTPPTNQQSLSFGIGENYGFPFIGQSMTANIPMLAANLTQPPILPTTTGLDTFNSTSSLYNQYDISQQQKMYVNGPQTPKVIQPPLEVWNKLKFWFCDDVKLSIPSAAIPFGQRFITINITTLDNLLFEYPSIYLESTNTTVNVVNIYNQLFGTTSNGTFGNNLKGTTNPYPLNDYINGPLNSGILGNLQDIINTISRTNDNPLSLGTNDAYVSMGAVTNGGYLPNINLYLTDLDNYLFYSLFYNDLITYNNKLLTEVIPRFAVATNTLNQMPSGANYVAFMTYYNQFITYYNLLATNFQNYMYKSYTPIYQSFGINTPNILHFELYINNIFVNPEVHDIFIKRIGFALIRVYRQQQTTINQHGLNSVLLSALKWPIEFMLIGLQPQWNITNSNYHMWRDWHRMTQELEVNTINASLACNNISGSTINQIGDDTYFIPIATIDTLSLVSHGIKIYDTMRDTFYSSYIPYHYGKDTIVTPNDIGAFMINFSLFPASYQPSGHINISRARETYIKFYSSYTSGNTPCNLMIGAVCINFLLISDGSAILRYST